MYRNLVITTKNGQSQSTLANEKINNEISQPKPTMLGLELGTFLVSRPQTCLAFIGPRPYWLIGRILNHNSVRLNATYGLAYRALVG